MRVAFDGRTIQDHFPGIGRYSYNLARALASQPQAPELLLLHDPAQRNTRFDLAALAAAAPRITLVPVAARNFSPAEQWRIPAALRRLGADVYHSPYYLMPYRPGRPAVVTVHDLIPFRFPEYFSIGARRLFGLTVRLAVRAARVVLADSEASARDIRQLLPGVAERVRAVPLAADPAFAPQPPEAVAAARAQLGLPGEYLLYFGSNKPHKNLERLARVYAGLPGAERVPLVLAGHWETRYPQVRDLVRANGWAARVRMLGPVPAAFLPALYAGALGFVFPSLYEGFGLPVLEAMAAGAPVACARASSLPEVAGDAALLFDPVDEADLAARLTRLLADADLRADLRARGLAQARRFSWQRTAADTLATYAEACRQGSP